MTKEEEMQVQELVSNALAFGYSMATYDFTEQPEELPTPETYDIFEMRLETEFEIYLKDPIAYFNELLGDEDLEE